MLKAFGFVILIFFLSACHIFPRKRFSNPNEALEQVKELKSQGRFILAEGYAKEAQKKFPENNELLNERLELTTNSCGKAMTPEYVLSEFDSILIDNPKMEKREWLLGERQKCKDQYIAEIYKPHFRLVGDLGYGIHKTGSFDAGVKNSLLGVSLILKRNLDFKNSIDLIYNSQNYSIARDYFLNINSDIAKVASTSLFGIGYTRTFTNLTKWSGSYSLGAGRYSATISGKDLKEESDPSLGLYQDISLHICRYMDQGSCLSDNDLSFGIRHIFVPDSSIQNQKLDGHLFTLFLGFGT